MFYFSDSCPGQNKNRTVARFLAASAANGKFNTIFQYFCIRGLVTGTVDLTDSSAQNQKKVGNTPEGYGRLIVPSKREIDGRH